MPTILDPKLVAMTNPSVDAQKVEEVQAIRNVLEQAGVAKKADYRLSHPLGSGPPATPAGGVIVRMVRGR